MKMSLFRVFQRILFTVVCGALAACASGYGDFYRPVQGVSLEAIATYRSSAPTSRPAIERTVPPVQGSNSFLVPYLKRGYFLIGRSSFSSDSTPNDDEAIEQAKRVGADLVVVFEPRYLGSSTTAIPLTTPTSSTTYSSGSATAYGPRGAVSAYGTGTTTTYGTTTTMIPLTVHRSEYGAAFFIKRRYGLGAMFRDLSDAERSQLQTNKGVSVTLVVDNSPAFVSDLLVGDIVVSIDGEPVANSQGFTEQMRARDGQRIALSLLRGGVRVEKEVQLQSVKPVPR